MLDLGAGTGALAWAAAECIPQLDKMTLMESDARMIALGKTLAVAAPHAAIRDAEWVEADMAGGQFAPHDLVALSYSLGELPADAASRVLEQAWNAARWMLIIIEPGTPAGFARIRDWRTQLIASGGNMLAPCPHQRDCPIAGPMPETKIESKTETKTGPETGKDWCHFAQRVERTALHRRLKGGQLGHEDEKFSYIAFSKVPVTLPEARIIRHPHVAPGVIKLSLCAEDGLRGAVITKRDRAAFRRARHTYWGANWGEAWDEAGGAEIQTEPRPSRSGGSLGE